MKNVKWYPVYVLVDLCIKSNMVSSGVPGLRWSLISKEPWLSSVELKIKLKDVDAEKGLMGVRGILGVQES